MISLYLNYQRRYELPILCILPDRSHFHRLSLFLPEGQ